MGSPCFFTRQQALQMGYFYWLRVTNSNHAPSYRIKGLPGYLKDKKFYLESKASQCATVYHSVPAIFLIYSIFSNRN